MSDIDHGIAGAVGAALAGGALAIKDAIVRKKRESDPATPEGHVKRISDLERDVAALKAERAEDAGRMTKLEARMQSTETMLAGAIGKLTESTDRQWKAIERLTESVDDLKGAVTRVDVEATIERELRKHARKEH